MCCFPFSFIQFVGLHIEGRAGNRLSFWMSGMFLTPVTLEIQQDFSEIGGGLFGLFLVGHHVTDV